MHLSSLYALVSPREPTRAFFLPLLGDLSLSDILSLKSRFYASSHLSVSSYGVTGESVNSPPSAPIAMIVPQNGIPAILQLNSFPLRTPSSSQMMTSFGPPIVSEIVTVSIYPPTMFCRTLRLFAIVRHFGSCPGSFITTLILSFFMPEPPPRLLPPRVRVSP